MNQFLLSPKQWRWHRDSNRRYIASINPFHFDSYQLSLLQIQLTLPLLFILWRLRTLFNQQLSKQHLRQQEERQEQFQIL